MQLGRRNRGSFRYIGMLNPDIRIFRVPLFFTGEREADGGTSQIPEEDRNDWRLR